MNDHLSTARLIMRLPEASDASAVAGLANDVAVTRYTARMPHTYGLDDACDFIKVARAGAGEGTSTPFFIQLKDGGALIGGIGLELGSKQGSAEIGYWLGRDYWNQGYTTEALAAVVDFGFDELKLSVVRGNVVPENTASVRVMEKLGMTVVGHEISPAPARAADQNVDIYEMTRHEWFNR
ncbi:MAG: GNAT family N-acetyltransferase [Alphaproteobacteria bacterium]